MTTRHSTKRALIASLLVLALCFTSLIGTTFAWFTDSVTSAGNIIKTGTLDVEMYWADGTMAVPTDDAGWTDASTGAIFDYNNWEPGYVQVRHIKIANEGSLALKYKVQIVANGVVSDLSDVIDVYYVDPAVQVADRTALTENIKLGTLTEVLAALGETGNGTLEAGKADTITIAFKMQETAGNEYQDKSIGSSFSVQLLATQLTYEPDSFDNQYDTDSKYPVLSNTVSLNGDSTAPSTFTTNDMKVDAPAELINSLADVAESAEIRHTTPRIAENVIVIDTVEFYNEKGEIIDLEALGNDKPLTVKFNVGDTFDVGDVVVVYHNGEIVATPTVDENKDITYTATHFCKVHIGFNDGDIDDVRELEAAIENGGNIIVNGEINPTEAKLYESWGGNNTYEIMSASSISGGSYIFDETAKYGLFLANSGKTLTLSNMSITTNSQWSIYASNYNGGTLNVNNVDITAELGAGFYSYSNGTTVLDNVKINHKALDEAYAASTPWAATAIAVSNAQNMIINSGVYVGSTWALYVYSSGANVVINGGTFKAPTVVAADAQNGAKAYVTINGGNFDGKFESVNVWGTGSEALITINGGNFTNFSTTANKRITIKGGNFDADPTNWLADGYIAVENNGVWTVGTALVTNADELKAALKAATDGSTILLANDITVDGDWDSRYTGGKVTKNITIDGLGNTLTFTGKMVDPNYSSAFRFEADATVRNLTIDMSTAIGNGVTMRAISSKKSLTVDNCTFIGNTAMTNSRAVIFGEGQGYLTRYDANVTVTNSTFLNWKRGVTDNENAADIKTVTVTGNYFENAGLAVSGYESVTVTGNEMNNGYIKVNFYTTPKDGSAVITDNVLDLNQGADNTIGHKSYPGIIEDLTVQDGFTIVD